MFPSFDLFHCGYICQRKIIIEQSFALCAKTMSEHVMAEPCAIISESSCIPGGAPNYLYLLYNPH